MGKSSLMTRVAQRLREQGVVAAILDLGGVGQNLSPEQWYDGLLVSLGEHLHLEDELDDFWQEHTNLGPPATLLRRHRAGRAARLGDKRLSSSWTRLTPFARCPSPPTSSSRAFAKVITGARRTRPGTVSLSVCWRRHARRPDPRHPDESLQHRQAHRHHRLHAQEAAPLAQGLGQSGESLLARVLYWTNGNPYLTQRLCRAVAEEKATRAADVDRLCDTLFLSKSARDTDDNLAFVRNRLLRSEADLASLLDLYTQVRAGQEGSQDDETNPLTGILRLSGGGEGGEWPAPCPQPHLRPGL
jgi:hypothetical protein